MIQDIYPHKIHNEFRPDAVAGPDDRVLVWNGKAFLATADFEQETLEYPRYRELKKVSPEELVYLFSIDEDRYFLHRCKPEARSKDILHAPGAEAFYTLPELRKSRLEPRWNVFAAYTGYHLAEWYDSNRYCGWCGSPSAYDKAERGMRCPVCGKIEYPRINPAVIVAVTNGDKIVTIRYRAGYGGMALIAGFTEIGETLEETVAREVMEEVGLRVKNLRYYKSQPWGFTDSLLMGYYCDLDGDDTIRLDRSELKEGFWLHREEITPRDQDISLTAEMVERFRLGKENDR
jgi:NAD+ diphosphatase